MSGEWMHSFVKATQTGYFRVYFGDRPPLRDDCYEIFDDGDGLYSVYYFERGNYRPLLDEAEEPAVRTTPEKIAVALLITARSMYETLERADEKRRRARS
mgnify:CR=1 FL=1